MDREKLFKLINAEREKQDAQWGGPTHDDQHQASDWARFIYQQLEHLAASDDVQERLVKIAALAIAALESGGRIGFCPTGYETLTGWFDRSGAAVPEICAGCGCEKGEHLYAG